MAGKHARKRGGLVIVALLALALAAGGAYYVWRLNQPPANPAVPAQYRALVLAAGRTCPQVTPALLAAQIEAESGWNPSARSHAGAQGLSQFMPDTWKRYGKDYDGDGQSSALDPGDAIPAQARLMCDLVTRYANAAAKGTVSGDPVQLALAGYNAGPENVIAAKGIPAFPETRKYVEKIMKRAPLYQEDLRGG